MAVTQQARRQNLGILTGSLFVVLWLAGMVVQGMGGTEAPRPTDDAATVAGHLRDGVSYWVRSSSLQILSAVALLVFAAVLAAHLRRTGRAGFAPDLALAGGIAASVTLMVSASAGLALKTDLAEDDAFVQLVYQLTFWLGGPVHVGALGLLVVAAASGLALPKWLTVTGFVVGGLGLVAAFSPLVYQLVLFTPIGRFLGFAWLLATTIMVALRREPAPSPSTVDESAPAQAPTS
jgi:hypothetical protein